ncbi:MAG: alpha/beta fold hydrolase [Candidatus Paceibacterales bacterium]
MQEKTALINNLRANFKIAGSGPAVLILHGWGGSSDSWLKVQKVLAEKGYKVICPDFPGFGKSKTPREPWSVTDYVRWTFDFAKSQDLERFFILGHSFGGRVAIKFALSYPEKIKALILCSSGGIKHKPSFKNRVIIWLAYLGNVIFSPKPLARMKDGARNIFYTFLRNRDYVKANGVMRETIREVIDEDLLPSLTEIKTKTLIVWGKKDKMLPVKDAYIFKENISNSRLEVLPQNGHSPNLEAPEKLARIIVHFLRS